MSLHRKIKQRKMRRTLRVRSKFKNIHMPRISIFRSAKHIYGQVIDDAESVTLASCSSLEFKKQKGDKKEIAYVIGKELGKRALEKKVEAAMFDRGSFLYHGRVKSFADGLREAGLKI